MKSNVRLFYYLAKPGIVYGNTISLIAGFLYVIAAGGQFSLLNLIYAVVGTALIMASACVANNIIDRDIDIYMARTNTRAIVTGQISPITAGVYSAILLLIGGGILSLTNSVALGLAFSGWLLYVFPYTYLKRVTYHSTLVGALPGAVPPLVGYYAAGGNSLFAAGAILLLLVSWQMVHFYAIAIFRQSDYHAAGIPVITEVKGIEVSVHHLEFWTYVSALGLLASTYQTNLPYIALIVLMVGWWLRATVYSGEDYIKWSRKTFVASLLFLVIWLLITIVSALTSLDYSSLY